MAMPWGWEWLSLLYCDLRFASSEAKFSTAFARRGLIAEYGIAWMLPRLSGYPMRSICCSRRVLLGPEEALRLGLVNRVFPSDSFMDGRARLREGTGRLRCRHAPWQQSSGRSTARFFRRWRKRRSPPSGPCWRASSRRTLRKAWRTSSRNERRTLLEGRDGSRAPRDLLDGLCAPTSGTKQLTCRPHRYNTGAATPQVQSGIRPQGGREHEKHQVSLSEGTA